MTVEPIDWTRPPRDNAEMVRRIGESRLPTRIGHAIDLAVIWGVAIVGGTLAGIVLTILVAILMHI